MWRNLFILYFVFVKKQRTIERKEKRSKISALESCYANRIYGTFGVEMRAYGQKLVKFCTQTHRRVNLSSMQDLTRFNKIATQGAPQMAVDKEANSLSRSKEEDAVVCLPGARIEHVTERVEKIMGRGKGGTILVHIGTNNADKEGTTTIVDKYRKLLKKTKEARVEQIILSGILPVFGNRIDGYRNSKRMAINGMVKRLCKEEDVGYVDLWDSVVGKEGMYARDGLHLSGKGAAVFAEGLSGAVASGLGKVRYLN